jgi:hypothetical protein
MVSTNVSRWTLIAAAAATLGVCFGPRIQGQEQETRRLSAAEFDRLHQLIKLQPGESRWMEIDWHPTVWEGRKKAAAEGKPLFLWAGSGGAPAAGC